MASPHTRVDTLELKEVIYRKIGHKRAEEYFNQLQNFLTLKLSKVEFNKSCLQTIGRENISLHNKLIRAIVQNSSQAKATSLLKSRKLEGGKFLSGNRVQSAFGDAFPRKHGSSIVKNLKSKDRPSPLGPLGKSPSLTYDETVTRLLEQQSASELHSLSSKPLHDDGEEVEQLDGPNDSQRWGHITAPLSVSVDKPARLSKFAPNETCQSSRALPDTVSLWSHLKRKLEAEGLGISMGCANVLNASLDAYLKRLIEPCINISRSRRLRGCNNNGGQFASGVYQLDRQDRQRSSSMLDFRVAMESNPSLLGVDWPVQLEKISQYSSME